MADAPRSLSLPEFRPAVLDHDALLRFFTDLAFETSVLSVALKGGAFEREQSPPPNLRMARDALLGGTAVGVQVHYQHEGVEWWDTVMRTEEGYRIVRIRK